MIYGFVLLILLIEILLVPMKEEKSNFLARFSLGIIIIMALNILEALVCFVFEIKMAIGIPVMDLVIAILLMIHFIRKNKIQKYEIKLCDIIFVAVMILMVIVITIINYEIPFKIKYQTSDAAVHFAGALNLTKEEGLLLKKDNNLSFFKFDFLMIGAYVNSGIFFEIFRGSLSDIDMYQFYILFDMFMLFFSGIMMYVTLSEISKDIGRRYIGFIIALLYALAYPLNSILMGSAYLTLSLIFITAIILVWNKKGDLPKPYFTIIMFLLNIGLIHSYTLFGIIVFLAEVIAYIVIDKKKSVKYIFLSIVLPLITLLVYARAQVETSSYIKAEGPMYKNYYSNFIIYIPVIIYTMYIKLKKKERLDFVTILFGIIIIFLPICYILKNEKMISAYYGMKFYYLFWIPTLFLFAKALYDIWAQKKIVMYIISSILIVVLMVSYVLDNAEYSDEDLMQDIVKENITTVSQMFKINTNIIKSKKSILNKEEIEIIKEAKNFIDLKEDNLEIVGNYSQLAWVYAFYRYSKIEGNDESTIFSQLYDVGHTEYILVFKRATMWRQIKDELKNQYNYIYETKWGGVMKRNE